MWWCCVQRSSVCSDDRAALRNADLDRRRSDGSATRVYGLERDGADNASREPFFRSRVRIPRTARRFDQDVVVVGRWVMSFFEKARAGKIPLAASDEWNSFSDARTVVDVARGNRLAASGAQSRSADGRVKQIYRELICQEFCS